MLISQKIFAQDCSVENDAIKGTYTGDCKKGKANGKGKSVGTDTYEGDFKNGLPEGDGTYTWNNGNTFKGSFAKGLKQGKGTLTFKRQNEPDSVIEGYWKNDIYVGKYEFPYTVYFKSKAITEFEVQYKKDGFSQITYFITNTSGDVATPMGGTSPRLKVDEVQLSSGRYGRLVVNDIHTKKTESILSEVTYPTRMKVLIGGEQVEIEFREPGSYIVDIHINQ
jgi:MORN repeat protein